MDNVTIGLALVAGFLSFISPCVLPLVPAYIGYMGGRLTHNVSRQVAAGASQSVSLALRLQMLLHGAAFVLGFTVVFVLIGLLTTALSSIAGQYVGTFTEILGRVGGVVIIFFGFQFMGLLPRLFNWLRQKRQASLLDSPLFSLAAAAAAAGLLYWAFLQHLLIVIPLITLMLLVMAIRGAFTAPGAFWARLMDQLQGLLYADTRGDLQADGRDGLLGSAFMGVVFSAGWTPCIGPLLGTILTVAAATGASTGDIAQGMLLLTAYSIGLGIPFIITAMLLNSAQGILRRLQRHMGKIELASGSMLVLIGLLVASGQLQSLSQTFSRGEFADFTFRVEECGVGFFEGELGFRHLGDCLSGALIPVAINQSANGAFTPDSREQALLFHAEAGEDIDVEFRSLSEPAPDFELTLYAPDNLAVASARKADSRSADGMLYPLSAITLADGGRYRLVIQAAEDVDAARFRIKVRAAVPLAPAANEGSGGALASDPLNSLTALASDLDAAIGLIEGNRAPGFAISTLQGQALTLADLRGKVLLLNFWGTWCGPCRREMPEFQKIYEEWGERGFAILAIAYNDSEEAMAAFRDEFGLSFPLALDASGDINDAYAIQTRPSSYLLDQNGIIVARHFGIMTEALLGDLLGEALGS